MTVPFNPARGLIIIRGDLHGPAGSTVLRLALDTGSSHTVVNSAALKSVGVHIARNSAKFRVNTATGTGIARRVAVAKLATLGREKRNFSVMTYRFKQQLRLDGLLGLDFLRGHRVMIDFPAGTIELT